MPTLRLRPVVYNQPTMIYTHGGAFREMVAPGALRSALERPSRTAALRDHSPSALLGRVAAGTLKLRDTPTALEASVELPPTELGHDTATLVERGDLSGASFGFTVRSETWHDADDDGPPTRVIRDVAELWDVSPCTFPAYEGTQVWMDGQRSPRSATPLARRQRLEFLEKQIARDRILFARSLDFGRRISRPEWAPRASVIWRHGCGHVPQEAIGSFLVGAPDG